MDDSGTEGPIVRKLSDNKEAAGWDTEEDTQQSRVAHTDRPATQRKVLSPTSTGRAMDV